MADGFRDDTDKTTLEELLRDVEDPEEREKLRLAWEATALLRCDSQPAPPLSPALQAKLRRVDEALSDDDLDMLAAAGTPFNKPDDPDLF